MLADSPRHRNCSMNSIIEHYKKHCHAEKALQMKESEPQGSGSRSESHLVGEKQPDTSILMNELQQLEQQFETALKQIRSQMNKHLLDSIAELDKKVLPTH